MNPTINTIINREIDQFFETCDCNDILVGYWNWKCISILWANFQVLIYTTLTFYATLELLLDQGTKWTKKLQYTFTTRRSVRYFWVEDSPAEWSEDPWTYLRIEFCGSENLKNQWKLYGIESMTEFMSAFSFRRFRRLDRVWVRNLNFVRFPIRSCVRVQKSLLDRSSFTIFLIKWFLILGIKRIYSQSSGKTFTPIQEDRYLHSDSVNIQS